MSEPSSLPYERNHQPHEQPDLPRCDTVYMVYMRVRVSAAMVQGVVYEGVAAGLGGDEGEGLFSGYRFWISARVPMRNRLISMVEVGWRSPGDGPSAPSWSWG
ncbi:hypothetical protein VTK73DRAFT_4738 [Phialemonium thermophilum]|uniref:Uncharacterized protein n=1 Tax=Phialemonium thermophilum TaxID=223376 RepID=A0ABR3V752_9PEZI